MNSKISSFILLALFFIVFSFSAKSQQIGDASSSTQKKTDQLSPDDPITEFRVKLRIRAEKESYEKLIKNGEEVAKLSEELSKSFEKSNTLSVEDLQKLNKMQKLSKKILNELGGDDDVEDESAEKVPLNTVDAFQSLQDKTTKLIGELKKTTRHTISVVAIETSSTVIKLVNFLRASFR